MNTSRRLIVSLEVGIDDTFKFCVFLSALYVNNFEW